MWHLDVSLFVHFGVTLYNWNRLFDLFSQVLANEELVQFMDLQFIFESQTQ